MTNSDLNYLELEFIDKSIFKSCGFAISNLNVEKEGQAYFAHSLELNRLKIKLRIAKITPTKAGQFVTLWQRNSEGITEPYSIDSEFDFCVVITRKEANLGVFIFPKRVLYENGVLSDTLRDGKRAIRVYPSWDKTASKQANKTQQWQLNYFIDLTENTEIDFKKVNAILNRS